MLPGSQSLMDVEPAARRGTEDWASSCPAEWAADTGRLGQAVDLDYQFLLRNPISRFSKEMTCWVNEWQMIQSVAHRSPSSATLWARLPDAGNPPAPDYSVNYLARYDVAPLADTCAFDAEYQARRTTAELLAREIARAQEVARSEARLSQALADAERVGAIIDLDAIKNAEPANRLVFHADDLVEHSLCGGEPGEIMSDQCFAPVRPTWQPEMRQVAPGIDEYVAYDLDPRDQHWLGGLGKSWKLRRFRSLPIPAELVAADVDSQPEAWAVPIAEVTPAPESFVAPDRVGNDLALESATNAAEINEYLDNIVAQAQQSALNLLQSARSASQLTVQDIDVLPELLPNLGQSMALVSEWVEDQQCRISSELCGMESAHQAGQWLGDRALAATQSVMNNTVILGHYMDLPADAQAPGDVYVIYVDDEGNSLAVPSSLARAWNRPEAEPTIAAEDSAVDSTVDLAIASTVDSLIQQIRFRS